ncbi:MAG: hypothetical protein KIT31_08140 [Deltaproteobacteria bacterium]|nr:hypothetical protein [Deltaproteobacteria bacterium]
MTANVGVVRALACVGVGPVEVLAGPELVAYGIDRVSRVSAGVAGSVRARIAAGGRWRVLASIDADLVQHRVEIARDGMPFAAIPRVALTGAVGLEWELP